MTDASRSARDRGDPGIRPLSRSDLPGIKAVIAATELFPPDLLDGMTAAHFADEASPEIWLTAEAGEGSGTGGPVAVLYCAPERMTSGTWNTLLIAVHPDHQGRGIGAALTRHVEAVLTGRGERVLLVETSGLPDFERTRTFYRGLGYEQEARIREFYAAGEDKIVFRKARAPTPRTSRASSASDFR